MKSCQSKGIPTIGLYVFTRPLGDQGRCDDGTIVSESSDLAMQAVASRPRLITEQQLQVFTTQFSYQALHRVWSIVDIAEKADFALAAFFGQRHGDLQLGGIKTDKDSAGFLHVSSPVSEARRRPSRHNCRSFHSGEPTLLDRETNIRSARCFPGCSARANAAARASARCCAGPSTASLRAIQPDQG